MYVGFMDLGKTYDMVNREAIWQVQRMHDVDVKLLNGFTLASFRVKGDKRERFNIDSCVRK